MKLQWQVSASAVLKGELKSIPISLTSRLVYGRSLSIGVGKVYPRREL